jgi:hypothetical protein
MDLGQTGKGAVSDSVISIMPLTRIIPRAELQHAFFPPTFHDNEVTPHLKPGDKRIWTALRISVELRDEITLHIPFREPSKVLSMLRDCISL